MPFFNPDEPLIRCKQADLDIQDLRGLLRLQLQIGHRTIFSALYTRVDQAILIWGMLTMIIFATAQFWPMSWHIQSAIWSTLTLIGMFSTVALTHFWAKVEQVSWVVWLWIALMCVGLATTNFGIFLGWSVVLMNLCTLWLGLSSIGYLLTGIALQSRTLLLACGIHLIGIKLVALVPSHSFLMTGFILGGTLWLLSELQWDMRLPIKPAILTAEEQEFNRTQHDIRRELRKS